jgi:phosphate:Na+ symporter
MASTILLDLMAGVALLLSGLHMAHSGLSAHSGPTSAARSERPCKMGLPHFWRESGYDFAAKHHSHGFDDPGFCSGGVISLVPALAIVLGANVGTALIVQALSFNISCRVPGLPLALRPRLPLPQYLWPRTVHPVKCTARRRA